MFFLSDFVIAHILCCQALSALMQVQQGMETLRQTAPNVLNTLGVASPNATTTPSTNVSSTPAPTPPSQNPLSQDTLSEV